MYNILMRSLENLQLDQINLSPLFPTRFGGDDRLLRASIQNFGILSPPMVLRTANGLRIIDGGWRLKIAVDLGHSGAPCFVYPEDSLNIANAFLLCLENNRWHRHFNLVEKAQLLKAAHEHFGGQTIPKTFWSLVDIPHNIRAIQQYKDLLKLPPVVMRYAVNNAIALPTLLGFLHFPHQELERLAAKLFVLPLNQNKLAEMLGLLTDLYKRDGESPLNVLEAAFKSVENEFNTQQKEQKIRGFLKTKRNPHYEQKLEEFQARIKDLPLTKDTRIQPAPFFEDDYIELSARIGSAEDLGEFLASLKDLKWAKLFE